MKSVRASVDYLLQVKATAPVQMQEVIDFLLESAFFDRDDDFFAKIVKAAGCDDEKYQWFNGMRYTRQEDGHYRGYQGKYLHRAVWEITTEKSRRTTSFIIVILIRRTTTFPIFSL